MQIHNCVKQSLNDRAARGVPETSATKAWEFLPARSAWFAKGKIYRETRISNGVGPDLGSVFAFNVSRVLPDGICAAHARDLALLGRRGRPLQYFQNQHNKPRPEDRPLDIPGAVLSRKNQFTRDKERHRRGNSARAI
jgi:hypothetical protein